MATNNTAFSPNADMVAQITGSGAAVPGTTVATYAIAGNTDISAIMQYSRFVQMTTGAGNTTVITSAVLKPGALLTVQVTNDAAAARTITFGTGFRTNATLVGTNSKTLLIGFISDGVTLNELCRTVGAIT
jgi:hypothetical protein